MNKFRLWRRRNASRISQFFTNDTPKWLNTTSQIASVVLAVLGILLTIYLSNQATEIKNLDQVIRELKTSDSLLVRNDTTQRNLLLKQDTLIAALTEIVEDNKTLVTKLSGIQQRLYDQNQIFGTNTAPSISIEGFRIVKINDTQMEYFVDYKNTGSRAAANFNAIIEGVVFRSPKSPYILRKINDKRENIISFQASESNSISYLLVNEVPMNSEYLNNIIFKLTFSFIDAVTKRHIKTVLHYRHVSKDFKIISSELIINEDRKLVDNLLK